MHLYFLTCPKVIPANIYYKSSRFIFALQTKRIGAGGLIRRYFWLNRKREKMNSFEDFTKRIENGERVYYTEFLEALGFDTSGLVNKQAFWDKDGFHEYDTGLSLDLGQEVYIVIDHCGPNLMSDQDTISIPSVCYSEEDAWKSIDISLNSFVSGKDGDPYISELTIIPNPIIQIYPGLKTVTVKIPILCGCDGSVISRHHFYKIVKKSITTF